MRSIVLSLPDDVAIEVEKFAFDRGMSVEEYLRRNLAEKLARDESFERATRYVLEKNFGLYRRLG